MPEAGATRRMLVVLAEAPIRESMTIVSIIEKFGTTLLPSRDSRPSRQGPQPGAHSCSAPMSWSWQVLPANPSRDGASYAELAHDPLLTLTSRKGSRGALLVSPQFRVSFSV